MNKQSNLIEKIIKLNSDTCPAITYNNPLIDNNVARALSRSIIKVVTNPEQNHVNTKLKTSILTNFRHICLDKSKEHLFINDNAIEDFIKSFIDEKSCDVDEKVLDKKMDAFLIKNLKGARIESKCKCRHNPETVLALLNLTDNVKYLTEDIFFWDNNEKSNIILEKLWSNSNIREKDIIDNISVKYTPFIEGIILKTCTNVLLKKESTEVVLSSANFQNLIVKCSISPKCFQITFGILNYLFIKSKFNVKILGFIHKLLFEIRLNSKQVSILYPESLQSILLFLDFDINEIPSKSLNKFTRPILDLLSNLNETCEHDLILVLSHYPSWFSLYINNRKGLLPLSIPMEVQEEDC